MSVAHIMVITDILFSEKIAQHIPLGTDILIFFCQVGEVLRSIRVVLFITLFLFVMKGIVFHISSDVLFLQVCIILFAAITSICGQGLWIFP